LTRRIFFALTLWMPCHLIRQIHVPEASSAYAKGDIRGLPTMIRLERLSIILRGSSWTWCKTEWFLRTAGRSIKRIEQEKEGGKIEENYIRGHRKLVFWSYSGSLVGTKDFSQSGFKFPVLPVRLRRWSESVLSSRLPLHQSRSKECTRATKQVTNIWWYVSLILYHHFVL
jgi:hypothetical protein